MMKAISIFIIIYFVTAFCDKDIDNDLKLIIEPIWNEIYKPFHDSNKTAIDRFNLYNNEYVILSKYYDLISGEIDIFHGNVYHRDNRESHELYKPEYIYDQRMWDVFYYYKSLKPNIDYGQYQYYINIYTGYYADLWQTFINFPNYEVKLQITDHHYNADLEYHFLFRFNLKKYLNK